ncbi:hypothetical protein PFISCL1PPCAC_3774, partial [Pristionchus fissidentatus]
LYTLELVQSLLLLHPPSILVSRYLTSVDGVRLRTMTRETVGGELTNVPAVLHGGIDADDAVLWRSVVLLHLNAHLVPIGILLLHNALAVLLHQVEHLLCSGLGVGSLWPRHLLLQPSRPIQHTAQLVSGVIVDDYPSQRRIRSHTIITILLFVLLISQLAKCVNVDRTLGRLLPSLLLPSALAIIFALQLTVFLLLHHLHLLVLLVIRAVSATSCSEAAIARSTILLLQWHQIVRLECFAPQLLPARPLLLVLLRLAERDHLFLSVKLAGDLELVHLQRHERLASHLHSRSRPRLLLLASDVDLSLVVQSEGALLLSLQLLVVLCEHLRRLRLSVLIVGLVEALARLALLQLHVALVALIVRHVRIDEHLLTVVEHALILQHENLVLATHEGVLRVADDQTGSDGVLLRAALLHRISRLLPLRLLLLLVHEIGHAKLFVHRIQHLRPLIRPLLVFLRATKLLHPSRRSIILVLLRQLLRLEHLVVHLPLLLRRLNLLPHLLLLLLLAQIVGRLVVDLDAVLEDDIDALGHRLVVIRSCVRLGRVIRLERRESERCAQLVRLLNGHGLRVAPIVLLALLGLGRWRGIGVFASRSLLSSRSIGRTLHRRILVTSRLALLRVLARHDRLPIWK